MIIILRGRKISRNRRSVILTFPLNAQGINNRVINFLWQVNVIKQVKARETLVKINNIGYISRTRPSPISG